MPRYQLPRTPKGFRQPGSGRRPGQRNKISVEARQLARELVNNPVYQRRLRRDFERRKLHPTIEALVWQYHLGRPPQAVAVAGSMTVSVNARLEQERQAFAALDLADLEVLAAESQRLVDRAFQLASKPQPKAIGGAPTTAPRTAT